MIHTPLTQNDDRPADYRTRMYAHYVHGRQQPLAPTTLDGLRPRVPFLTKVIREYFPLDRDAAILELGCGHGALTYLAQKAGYRNILAVDRSPDQVAEARKLGIAAVREGDLMETLRGEPDASRDVVVTFDVLEHFRKDEVLPFTDEVWRVLKDGGKWVIHTANGESPFGSRIRFGDFTHELAFTRSSISQVLLASCFSRVSCFEDAPVPHGLKSAVRWILWKVIRAGWRAYMAVETGDASGKHIFSQNFLVVAVK